MAKISINFLSYLAFPQKYTTVQSHMSLLHSTTLTIVWLAVCKNSENKTYIHHHITSIIIVVVVIAWRIWLLWREYLFIHIYICLVFYINMYNCLHTTIYLCSCLFSSRVLYVCFPPLMNSAYKCVCVCLCISVCGLLSHICLCHS